MSERTVDDDAEGADAPADVPRPRDKRRLLIFIAAGLVLLVGTGGVLYYTGVINKLTGGGHKTETADAEKPAPAKPSVFYDLPDMLVNLNSTGRKTSFLKISVSLELSQQEDVPKLAAVLPIIIDNFQVYLRELRVEDLRGSSGLYRLREELLARVNAAAAPIKVKDVLFKEMLVQ